MINELPLIVLWINGFVLLILLYTFLYIIVRCRQKGITEAELPFLIFGIVSTISLFGVNVPSFLNHYIVYFADKQELSDSATWMRFLDRYSMIFVATINDLRVQKRVLKWLSNKWKTT